MEHFQILGKQVENADRKIERNKDEDYDEKFKRNTKSDIKSECPQCGTEVLDLKQHIRRIHSQKPKVNMELFCKDCGKRCTNQNQLTLHWSYVHKRVDNLYCNLCEKPCPNMAKLRQHTMICIAKRMKEDNNLDKQHENTDNKEIDSLESQNTVSSLECQEEQTDDMKSYSERTTDFYDLQKGVENLICNLCRKSCPNMSKLKRHTRKCLPKYIRQETRSDYETIGNKVTDSAEDLHKRVENTDCHHCGKTFPNMDKMSKHNLKCFYKGNGKSEYNNKFLPVEQTQSLLVEKQEPVCDLIIKEEFNDSCFLNESFEMTPSSRCQYHEDDTQNKMVTKDDTKSDAVETKLGGNSGSQLACQLCPKILANKKGLKDHMARIHSDEARVVCEHCAKEFKSTNIKNHVKEMHCNFVESKCPTCEKYFQKESQCWII